MSRAVLAVSLLFFAGCNCNANQDYSFPVLDDPTVLEPPTNFGSWLSMDVAPDGTRVTMAYYDLDRTGIGYAVGMPNEDGTITWAHERVDGYPDTTGLDLRDVGRYASQRTAPDGTVWAAYQDVANGTLRVAHRNGPHDWEEPIVVDGTGAAGNWVSLKLDGDGYPVIVHCDGATVRRSAWDGSAFSSATLFTSQAVDDVDANNEPVTRPGAVSYTSLLIDGGTEYIAFYDAAAQTLNLLEGAGTSFAHTVVDADGDVGAWPSMSAGDNELAIAYQDVGNQDLRLATRGGAGWSVEVIDDGELRGADTALFRLDDELAVVYFDGWENDAILATRSGANWDQQNLGEQGAAVGFHNEVVYAAGYWWAGSYDHTHGTLHVTQL